MKFKYFRSVKGHVVHRYGTDTLIGVTRGKEGHKWNTEKIVAIPEVEYLRHLKAYRRAVKSGALKESSKSAFEKQNKEQEAEANKSKGKEKPKKGGAGRSPKKANKGG
ncbi:MAG: hypothetical protein ACYTDW_18745 [Planctomycetota bacterium]|jgi:hypothetical protein